MKKSQLLIAVCCILTAGSAYAQPAMYAPWECGTTQQITQGNYGDVSHNNNAGLSYSDTWAWDIGMPVGTKVVAPADGTVGFAVSGNSYGCCDPSCGSYANYVQICYDGDYAGIFWHLSEVYVRVGQKVKQGDVIGLSGNTGHSCGAHLHYAVTYCSQWYNSRPATWAGIGNPTHWQYVTSNNCPSGGGGGNPGGGNAGGDEDIYHYSQLYDPQNTDINGDGKADICGRASNGIYCSLSTGNTFGEEKLLLNALSDANGWNDITALSTIRFADINGDKKADICVRSDDGIECWLSNGSGFGNKTAPLTAISNANGYNNIQYISTMRFADVNGDGKDDFCARMKDSFKCWLSTGSGFGQEMSINDLGDSTGWNNLQYGSTLRMADVDGDGKMDVCARGFGTVYCWFSNGNSWSGEVAMQPAELAMSDANGWNAKSVYTTLRMPDVNGDGKADLCAQSSIDIHCQLSKGRSGFTTGPKLGWKHADGWADPDHQLTIMYGDINGDGKDDICGRASDGMHCHLSKGTSFDSTPIKITEFSDAGGWNKPEYYKTFRMGDMNGDGKAEICARGTKGVKCYAFDGSKFNRIVDGNPVWNDAGGWNGGAYYPSIRFGGKFKNATPTCTPTTEICDGKDNDCDGLIDEDDVCKPAETCTPTTEICDGKDNDCDGLVDEDDVCKPACTPTTEICDGIDNDCDGKIDEDGVCDAPEACKPSMEICNNRDDDCDGKIDEDGVCDDPGTCVPQMEICDGKDNNCNGLVDEGGVCNVPDNCVPETEICDGIDNNCNGLVDEGNVCNIPEDCKPSIEICDGKDNNCNGLIDEGGVCNNPGTCIPQVEICDGIDNNCNGQIDEGGVCNDPGTCIPQMEICDGKDNNCNGQVDEGGVCDVPEDCRPTTEICDGIDNDCDGFVDEGNVCNVPEDCKPEVEICDGKDNNCNGLIDEGGVCDDPGTCKPEVEICDGIDNNCDGQVDEDDVCRTLPVCKPSEEICDSIDNDCDGLIDEDGVCDPDPENPPKPSEPSDPEDECKNGNCNTGGVISVESSCSIGNKAQAPSGMMSLFGIFSALSMIALRRRKTSLKR